MREQDEENTGETARPSGVDARAARGLQINHGAGNFQFNDFAQPSLEDDLRNLSVRDIESAYGAFCERDHDRQVSLLSEYPRSEELVNLICARAGHDTCAGLLYGMAADRVMQRLRQLENAHRTEVLERLAARLAADTEGAPARIREYAAANRDRAAQLLWFMTRLDDVPERARTHTAVRLLPGPEFILDLPDGTATVLLKSLLFRYGPAPAGGNRQLVPSLTREGPLLLEQLVELDAERVTKLLMPLDATMIAACVRHLRVRYARRILQAASAGFADRYEELLDKLPRPMTSALLGEMTATARSRAGAPARWSTGWSWIDACLTSLTYAAPILRRLVNTSDQRLPAPEVRQEIREIWRAASSRVVRDGDYYRRQRNHLAVGTVVLLTALVASIVLR